jgi:predicted GNAT family N-acyltransferase
VGIEAPRHVRQTPAYEIRRTQTRQELAAAMALRYEVFCKEQGVPRHEERDGRDYDALHLIAVRDGDLLATCRLVFVGPTVQFSRMAVAQHARRQGIASEMLKVTDRETREGGAHRIVLHAQCYARSLYDKAGYVVTGREFTEAGIRHVAMEKVL